MKVMQMQMSKSKCDGDVDCAVERFKYLLKNPRLCYLQHACHCFCLHFCYENSRKRPAECRLVFVEWRIVKEFIELKYERAPDGTG